MKFQVLNFPLIIPFKRSIQSSYNVNLMIYLLLNGFSNYLLESLELTLILLLNVPNLTLIHQLKILCFFL